jgi:hypothetical protein
VSAGEIIVASGKAAGAVSALAKSSPAVLRFAKRAVHRWRHGYATIPVFGGGGVGKSTVAQILAGAAPDAAYSKYEESLWTEVVPLTGDIPGALKVAPGQLARVDRHWPDLFKSLSNGKSIGLINVVSYGYHALEINTIEESSAWKPGMSMPEFKESYTKSRQQIELQLLEELIAGLSATTTKIWMVTVINKQDLWHKETADVLKYYQEGEYSNSLGRIEGRMGSRAFQHEYIPACLAISNLTTGSGQIVSKSVGGYDVNLRNDSLAKLSKKIHLLVSK